MTAFDAVVVLIGVMSILSGLMKGMIRSVVGIASLLVGIYFASDQYRVAAAMIRPWVDLETVADLAGFLIILAVFLLLGTFVGRALQGLARTAKLGWMDRSLGAGFGFVRGWMVASAIYLALTAFSFGPDLTSGSVTSPLLRWGADRLVNLSSSEFTRRIPLGWGDVGPTVSSPSGGR